MKNNFIKNISITMIAMLVALSTGFSSSHREAPLIANDPLADNVDLYAFKSPDNPDMITLIATYVPLQLPQGGPNYYTFGENIRYEVHVDNDASVPGDEITYRFTFNIINEDPSTFFNIRLGAQNQKTTYTLERSIDGGVSFQTIITNGVVPPNNIGDRSITGGAGLNTDYNTLFQNAVTTASSGEVVFAGPTDDPFFVDLAGIFDLGDAPRQNGNPSDAVACFNVSAIAIQVPITTLLKAGAPTTPTNILDSDYVIGVWASASRPAVTTISKDNDDQFAGDWVQVSRLGMPLTNEAVIAIGDKDYWNSLTPYDEITETSLDEYFYNPELALYMDDSQFGGAVPALAPLRIQSASLGAFDFRNGQDGLFGLKGSAAVAGTALDDAVFGTLLLPAAGKPRSVDLWPAFHTGVPNVRPYQLATGKGGDPLAAGKPFVNNFLPNGGDMLRLNMAVPATSRADANFSSLGLIQAAAIGLTVAPFNTNSNLEFIPNMDGFPNGRRLEDDVTRIELQAVSGVVLAAIGLWYDDYDPMTSPSPVTDDLLNVLTYTTGIENNDKDFTSSFPYLAQPHSGTGACSGELFFKTQNLNANADAKVFVSSNNAGTIAAYGYSDAGGITSSSFGSVANDADGVHYDELADVLYQLNRTDNVINAYSNVQGSLTTGGAPTLTATSTSDFTNGREIAVSGNKLVVAQDASASNGDVNQFVTYTISGTSITLDKVQPTDINLWGITFDGADLVAIVDNSSDVAVFNDFLAQPNGAVTASAIITVSDMVRTHGLTYDADNDIMILTDVGSGAVADDGAFAYITNWIGASADGTITAAEQIRIEGPLSTLGNPVDVAYDDTAGLIFIAERANAGGRFLTFNIPTLDGDVAPASSEFFQGASAVSYTSCRVIAEEPESIVFYDLDGCTSFFSDNSNADYSEFVPAYPNTLDCASVSAGIVNRTPSSNTHSCTPGFAGEAMCVGSMNSCAYSPGNSKAILFDVTLNPSGGETASISQLSFYEKAPSNYDWIDGASGPNNYPTRYGLRVLKDGAEIFRSIDISTTTGWTLEAFDFSDASFSTGSVATYTFELLAYCLVGNNATVDAWDIDEINVLGVCSGTGNRVAVSGALRTASSEGVEGAIVSIESPLDIYDSTTEEDGLYAFSDLPIGEDYYLSAAKNDDHANGVSTLDLIIIQKHLLGIQTFNETYKYIAADVNQSDDVSAIDLVVMRKLILGIYDEFPSGLSWNFIDAEVPITSNNVFNTDFYIALEDLDENKDNTNLLAIKYGDVNNDVEANFGSDVVDVRTDATLDFTIPNLSVEKGDRISIPFKSSNFNAVYGFQMTMAFNGLQYDNIVADNIDISDENLGHLDSNNHTFSWFNHNGVSVKSNFTLFTINVIADRDGKLADMVEINNSRTEKEAYKENLVDKIDIKLFTEGGEELLQNALYQNVPNPFLDYTDISFNIIEAGLTTLTVFDVNGKVVYSNEREFAKGAHTFSIHKSDLQSASGMLYYSISVNGFTQTRKMTIFK
jgi:hypothetical protein